MKSVVDNYEEQQRAAKDLAQAFGTQKEAVPTAQIQAFLDKNKDFISNQYDAEEAIATATRAGISWKDTQLLVQDALNLSIVKHESMSQAMETLTKAAAGGRAQLADLGITSKELSNDTNAVANAQKAAFDADVKKAQADRDLKEGLDKVNESHNRTQFMLDHLQDLKAKDLAATQNATKAHQDLKDAQSGANSSADRALILHDLLKPKLDGETNSVSELQRSQHRLNTDWQDFSVTIGPPVEWVLNEITTAADTGVEILTEYAQIVEKIIQSPGKLGTAVNTIESDVLSFIPNPFRRGKQFGGQVYSGQSFLVGESGPELLTMGQGQSGNITPNDQLGGADLSIIEQNTGAMVDLLAQLIDQSSGGLGYSTLAAAEYARSRGMR